VDAFIGALDTTKEDAEPVVAAAVMSICHPEFWLRLLTAARERPKWQLPVTAVLESGALAANTETRLAVGELMRMLSPTLEPEDHRRLLEEPVQRAAALFAPEHAQWREEALDQLVGYLDVTRLQDTALRDRLAGLLAGDGPPAAPEPPKIVSSWSSLSLAEVIGNDTYAALGDGARSALDDLRTMLEVAVNGEVAPPGLEAAFRCAVAAAGTIDAASVRELITRAADRLALDPAVLPDTDLGALVVGLVLDACGQKGGAQ
jgi:hypothetical protein